MSVYDGYSQIETGTADFEAEAFREATLKAQVRSLRELAERELRIAGLKMRLETLEGAVEAVSRLAISLSQKLAADRLKREMDSAIEACRKVAERIEP